MKEITAEEFYQETEDGIVIVDFFAPWCVPCKALLSQFDRVETEVGDKIKIVKIDVDKETDLASNYGVMSVPTVFLYKDGQFLDKFVGARPKEFIIPWVKEKAGEF